METPYPIEVPILSSLPLATTILFSACHFISLFLFFSLSPSEKLWIILWVKDKLSQEKEVVCMCWFSKTSDANDRTSALEFGGKNMNKYMQ